MTRNFKVIMVGAHVNTNLVTAAITKINSEPYSMGIWDFTTITNPVEDVDYFITWDVVDGVNRYHPLPKTDNAICIYNTADYNTNCIGSTDGKRIQIMEGDTDTLTVDGLYQRIWHELLHTINGLISSDYMNITPSFVSWCNTNSIVLVNFPTPEGQSDTLEHLLLWNRYLSELARSIMQKFTHNISAQTNNYVFAVEFDDGGDGLSYNDTTPTNLGTPYPRRTDGASVDTEVLEINNPTSVYVPDSSYAYNIAYIRDGEWLKYTLNVLSPGYYYLEYAYSTPNTGCIATIFVDAATTPSFGINLENTGSFKTWQVYRSKNYNQAIYLTTGTHVFKVLFNGDGQNFLNMNLSYDSSRPVVTAPVAAFSADVLSGVAPLNVKFTDNSSNSPSSWLWDMGDGVQGHMQNPNYYYNVPGIYTVALTATNASGSDIEVKEAYITVLAPATPVAAAPSAYFEFDTGTGVIPCSVKFTDATTNTPTSWLWDFKDGSTSVEQNPTHVYMVAGDYSPTLTATNALGSNTKLRNIQIKASATGKPETSFTSTPTTGGESPLTVQFTDTTTTPVGAPIIRRTWDFGDGSASTETNPIHTYTSMGKKTVIYSTTNINGTTIVTKTDYFDILPHDYGVGVEAKFHALPTTGHQPLTVKFVDDSTGNPATWLWDFGDGNTSTLKNPSHTYNAQDARNYDVTLTVTGYNGTSNTALYTDFIIAEAWELPAPTPILDFTAEKTACEVHTPIQFVNMSVGTLTNILWNFGWGYPTADDVHYATSMEFSPVQTYNMPGIYSVSLTATVDGVEYFIEKQGYIRVTPASTSIPVTDFTVDKRTGIAPLSVQFSDTTTNNPYTWFWNFGDNTTSMQQNPKHEYRSVGVYSVSLTTTNSQGSSTRVYTGLITVTSDVVVVQTDANVEHNNGLLTLKTLVGASSNNIIYRPKSIRSAYGDYSVMVSKTTTTDVLSAQVGLLICSAKELLSGTNPITSNLPYSGYGIYLDYNDSAIAVKKYEATTTNGVTTMVVTELNKTLLTTTLSLHRFYTIRVNRINDGYITVYLDGVRICRVYDSTWGNGYSGIIIHDETADSEYVFDDLIFDELGYTFTPNQSVYLGGVSHGGKFDVCGVIENKFIVGEQLPPGKYYAEVCVLSNCDSEVMIDYKNFTNGTPITFETYDNLNDNSELTQKKLLIDTARNKHNMKINLDVLDEGCECGITVSEINQNNYKPVTILEYIALAPIASNLQQTMFPQDIAMMVFAKPSSYKKLENKKVR